MIRIAAVLGLVAALSGRADADEREAEANARFEQGLEHFRQGRYAAAIASFEAAHELLPSPELLYNIAQAYRRQGDCDHALEAYREYLAARPDASNRTKVEGYIRELGSCDPRGGDAPAPGVRVGGELDPSARSPFGQGRPDTGRLTASADRPGRTKRIVGLVTGAGGAGLLLTGAYFTHRANRADDEIDALFDSGGTWGPEHDEVVADGKRSQNISLVLYAAGSATLVTGVLLYVVGASQRSTAKLGLADIAGARGAALTWSF
jgi:tetratricopeptide (TPR) repeat protein